MYISMDKDLRSFSEGNFLDDIILTYTIVFIRSFLHVVVYSKIGVFYKIIMDSQTYSCIKC